MSSTDIPDLMMNFDDEDDEFANLFSFATASPPAVVVDDGTTTKTPSNSTTTEAVVRTRDNFSLSPPVTTDNDSAGSEDSFLQLLEQNKEPLTLMDGPAHEPSTSEEPTAKDKEELEATDLQDLLDWLDQDDDAVVEATSQEVEGEEVIQPPTPKEVTEEKKEEEEPVLETEPQFQCLEDAIKSPKSNLAQIRDLLAKESFEVSSSVRPYLWCRVICGKTMEDILTSSVADSFEKWEQSHQYLFQQEQEEDEGEGTASHETMESQPSTEGTVTSSSDVAQLGTPEPTFKQLSSRQKDKRKWVLGQADQLSDRIVAVRKCEMVHCQKALASLLLNHYFTGQKVDNDGEDDQEERGTTRDGEDSSQEATNAPPPTPDYQDTLLPPVACAILSASVPKTAAAVMLSHIVPHFMPILALTRTERENAAQLMHRQFYLLAAYHLPSLVLHLDRYLPNWFLWPDFEGHGSKQGQGYIPQSFLLSHMAGESGHTNINPQWILALWDLILTSSNNSLRFFLVLAVLEAAAHDIVLLTDDELKTKLVQVLSFQQEDVVGDFSIQDAQAQISNKDAVEWVKKWTSKAQILWERTPLTISRRLKRVEDAAVKQALTKRQEEAEERMKLKLEAGARAHQEALEAERERKADEARLRLTRARLVAFYRQYNPGNETNIDKIMDVYKDRFEVLDAKLKQKYGIGFNPAVKPKSAQTAPNTVKPVTHGTKKDGAKEDDVTTKRKRDQIVAKVSPSEVLPAICWSKKANKVRMTKLDRGNFLEEKVDALVPLKFYLVDSRPTTTSETQGRFPTSAVFPPDDLTDADRLKEQENTFEALRGAVHIVIMGEGFAALPALYGHKVTAALADCIAEDDARNNNCALFFLKKGFPFVSILDGGFAGAHSFLIREGPKHHLYVNDVLADYDPTVSLFGQFERVHNSTGREKAQRALQNIFDSSLVALTKNSRRLETLTTDIGHTEQQKKGGNMVTRFFAGGGGEGGKPDQGTSPRANQQHENKPGPPVFRNPFARKNQTSAASNTLPKENSSNALIVESVDDLVTDASEKPLSESATTSQPVGLSKLPMVQSEQAPKVATTAAPEHPRSEMPKNNPFAGFGAAFKQAAAKAAEVNNAGNKGPLGINPFARFNPGGRNLDRSRHGFG